MYAIVEVAGKQFKAVQGKSIKVPLLEGVAGSKLQFDRVLLYNDGKETQFGNPLIDGTIVEATLEGHGRDRKILVYKFRRRKGYQKENGHRQNFSMIKIDGIKSGGAKKAASKKTEQKPAAKAATPKKTSSKAEAAPKKTAAAKKAATTKKAATPKKTAKKASGSKAASGSKKSE